MSFEHWFLGDADAVNFAQQLWDASQKWDDAVDEGERSDINGLFQWLAFGKEYHPFFQKHADVLRPALLVMYLQWRDANVLESGSQEDIEKAYMLRAGIYSVYNLMAWVVGGEGHSRTVGPDVYRAYGETLSSLKEDIQNA